MSRIQPGRVGVTSSGVRRLQTGRYRAVLLAVLSLVACGAPGPKAGDTASASAPRTTSPSAAPVPATTPLAASSPRQIPGPSSPARLASVVPFACRLPVTAAGRRQFIAFPSGVVEDAGPVQSTEADSYSWLLGQWSMHGRSSFSPDGLSYAWSETGLDGGQPERQHVTDARTGSDRVVHQGDFLFVLAWSRDGIYMSESRGEGSTGLYLMDPATGAVRQLDSSGGYLAVAGGAAWRMGDTAYHPQYELTRVDLKTGAAQSWFSTVASVNSLQLLGFDAENHPMVLLHRYPTADSLVLVISGPNQSAQVYRGTDGIGGTIFLDKFDWVTDAHGTWIAGQDGLWFFDGSFRRVISGPAVRPAGECR